MERSQLRRVIPFPSVCVFEEGVVALDMLAGYLANQMPHPNVSLVHFPKQVSVTGFFEEKDEGEGERKVMQAIDADSHAVVYGSTEDEEGHCMEVSLFVDQHIGVFDGCALVFGLVEIPQ